MEVLYTALILSSLLIFFLTLKIKNSKQRQKEGRREAPGPWNLPILGSLHRVVGQQPPHQTFRDLSAVYGPIMRLKLGDIHAVIISSAEAAREIMKTHDIHFATRPINDSVDAIFYGGNNIIFGPYGEFWRQMRRLCNMELLSMKRVRSFRAIREEEVSDLIRFIAASSGVVINLSSKMAEASNNIIARATIGGRCDDQKLFLSALSDAVEFLSGFTIVDLFTSMPFIGMLMAGSETTSTTLEWAMSEMIRNPMIMEKAKREVREVLGDRYGLGKLADEELICGRLTYLQLVIKETLRLHPPGPLLLPRENQESGEIMGYVIPAKTKVMVNMWAIGREEKYWGDPDNFRPERFEENLVDFKGAHFEYVPFGAGRRICPGMQFALFSLEIVLAHLLYYFDWKLLGKKGEKLDMREAFGITTRRKSPLCLVPTLRFPIRYA